MSNDAENDPLGEFQRVLSEAFGGSKTETDEERKEREEFQRELEDAFKDVARAKVAREIRDAERDKGRAGFLAVLSIPAVLLAYIGTAKILWVMFS